MYKKLMSIVECSFFFGLEKRRGIWLENDDGKGYPILKLCNEFESETLYLQKMREWRIMVAILINKSYHESEQDSIA